MDGIASFEYDMIQSDQIRLCRFYEDGESISAVLETFSTGAPCPKYTALSYTWSTTNERPSSSCHMQVGEQYMPVLDSLWPFFRILRSRHALLHDTWWWIDSICIDQRNDLEKAFHVRNMKEIFEDAHNVIAWLGDKSDDSDLAVTFMQQLHDLSEPIYSDEERRAILRKDDYRPHWIALRNFFLRKWWTRIWTIQEFVTPTDVSLWCGRQTISKIVLCGALWVADRTNSVGFKDTIAFHHAWNRRRAWVLTSKFNKPERYFNLSLLSLAAYFCSNEATNDRDRLYGLHAISTKTHPLEISYSLSVDEVYLRFAQSFIEHYGSLDIISFASLFRASPGSSLPSWVPDWRCRIQPLVVPLMVSQSAKHQVGNLRPPAIFEHGDCTLRYAASRSAKAIFAFEGSILVARGVIVDTVDGMAGTHNPDFVQSSRKPTLSAGNTDSTTSSAEIVAAVCRSVVLDSKDRYLRYAMPTKEFYHDFYHLCLLALAGPSASLSPEFQQWFDRVRSLRVGGMSLENMLCDVQQNGTEPALTHTPSQDEYIQDSFYGRFIDTVERMSLRLMTSHKGRLGMVPEAAAQGDLVCFLFGCSVPVILRKSRDQDSFILIGECFLDGYMAGEAMDQSNFAESDFRIV